MVACSLIIGAAVSAALLSTGADPTGSALFGVGLAGFAATFAGVAAVTSQILDVRRRAAGFAAAVMAVSFLLRMVANSTDGRAWLGWLTPFGWMDHLAPFGDPQLSALLVLIVVPVLLLVAAAQIRNRRDTGGALLGTNDSRRPRLRGLGGPAIFAWRTNLPVLTGWVLGLGAYAFVLGALLTTMIDFLARDANYQQTLADLGLTVALTVDGFVGVMSVTLGVGFALYAAWRIGAVRSEEESGRADNLLTRPLTRSRWLLGHAGLTLVGAALLTILSGLAIWAGAMASGSDQLTVAASLRAVLNTGSVVVLVTGLALLTFGLLPRLTVAVPVAVTVGGYVLTLLGPALSWPGWIIDLSPFTHLAYVPAQPFAAHLSRGHGPDRLHRGRSAVSQRSADETSPAPDPDTGPTCHRYTSTCPRRAAPESMFDPPTGGHDPSERGPLLDERVTRAASHPRAPVPTARASSAAGSAVVPSRSWSTGT